LSRLEALNPDIAIVVAFGQIFGPELLELPRRGCINLHASLLPGFRGAAPIQAAIVAGESVTGVTTMLMDQGLDTGDILLQKQVDIGAIETAAELSSRLAETGGKLVVQTLDLLDVDGLERRPQNDDEATLAPRLDRSDGRIDWTQSSSAIFARVRGFIPWPGTWTDLRGEPTKILWGLPVESSHTVEVAPGTFLGVEDERLVVACGEATVFGVERLQRAGRTVVDAVAFVNGERLEPGERFG